MLILCKTIIPLFVAVILFTGCKQQSRETEPEPTNNTWLRTYGDNRSDFCGDILPAADSGYFVVGGTNIQYEPQRQGDMLIFKTNDNGVIEWERTYGGAQLVSGRAVLEAGDGGLVIAGATISIETQGMDVYLIKLDQTGNQLWTKRFGGPLDEWISTILPANDGGYILIGCIVDPDDIITNPGVAGYTGFEGRSNIYMAKIDTQGNYLWSHHYDSDENILAFCGKQTDGGFLIAANVLHFPQNDNDINLMKVDQNGNALWTRRWPGDNCMVYELIQTSDGNFLLGGAFAPAEETDYFTTDFLFIKVDPSGNEIWRNSFGQAGEPNRARVITITSNGGYMAVGGDTRIRLIKIDSNGNFLWERGIENGSSTTHNAYARILQHEDGGYIVAGTIFGENENIFIAKTDAQGNINVGQ